jgi:hypothetical protein
MSFRFVSVEGEFSELVDEDPVCRTPMPVDLDLAECLCVRGQTESCEKRQRSQSNQSFHADFLGEPQSSGFVL